MEPFGQPYDCAADDAPASAAPAAQPGPEAEAGGESDRAPASRGEGGAAVPHARAAAAAAVAAALPAALRSPVARAQQAWLEARFRSDVGWGCMIRSGQMLLANTLLLLHAGRDWRRRAHTPAEMRAVLGLGSGGVASDSVAAPARGAAVGEEGSRGASAGGGADETPVAADAAICALFGDSADAPFSLQRVTAEGLSRLSMRVGCWYGPAAVSACLSHLVHQQRSRDAHSLSPGARAALERVPVLAQLEMHVAMDGLVSLADLRALCSGAPAPPASTPGAHWRPLLLVVPLRLGLASFNADYAQPLAALLRLPQCMGMVGGRPRRSFYYVGCRGVGPEAEAFYLDPHTAQPALATDGRASRWPLSDADLASCHCSMLRKMRLSALDPSLAIAFLCHSDADLADWAAAVRAMDATNPPLFAVVDRPRDPAGAGEGSGGVDTLPRGDQPGASVARELGGGEDGRAVLAGAPGAWQHPAPRAGAQEQSANENSPLYDSDEDIVFV
mmetsp:Transcript_6667/g.19489  ORF Transcript_6667/g.19489 Transcript_6667/m.19489 type:complete len:503 (+) Transcript_6667:582-2090(+)